ncbi:perlucin-like isoform X2 [Haliotis rufescens]|uniref:perlucin-like isoform X2 n=1 Tax=Haliotis rufescens TaxID=6454 RepID=UPI00201F2161|nr:perlucin-like isoform X2 [Haliotis rufescens]
MRLQLLAVLLCSLASATAGTQPCHLGFIQHKASCYWFSNINGSFAEASAYCRYMESHLATIANKDEDDFLRGRAIRRGKAESYWLGATDLNLEGRWLWEGRRPMVYSNWSPHQPDNYKGREHCLEMRRSYSNYLWNDVPCYAFNDVEA